MKRFALLTLLIGFSLGACERHDFEGPNGTRKLHEHHDSTDAHESDDHHPKGDEAPAH